MKKSPKKKRLAARVTQRITIKPRTGATGVALNESGMQVMTHAAAIMRAARGEAQREWGTGWQRLTPEHRKACVDARRDHAGADAGGD